MNLSDDSWQQIARGFADFFTRYAHVSPAVLDDLGPGLHLAVHDADPVIALGSGDLMGAFGTNVLRRRGTEMVMLPIMLSVFTRPCTVLIETKDAARTARMLRQAASSWRPPERIVFADFRVSFYQVDDRDAWVWTMDLEGIVKLRFGVEVIDRFLVLRNIPWSANDRVVTVGPSAQNGAQLTLTPAACRLQLPGLFATATDQERRAVMGGLGRLYPLMIGGIADPEAAAEAAPAAVWLPSRFCRRTTVGSGRISISPAPSTDRPDDSGNRASTRTGRSDCCMAFSRCS